MAELTKRQKFAYGLGVLINSVPLNSGKINKIGFISFNRDTCNTVLRTDKGIVKAHLKNPELTASDKEERETDFVGGVHHLSTLANIFPESYTPIRDFREISKKEVNQKNTRFFPYSPEKILFTITDEVKGPRLDQEKALNLPLEEKLDISIELGEIFNFMHRGGINYNDLKPSNVILNKKDKKYHPRLFDLESAKHREEFLTIGSPEYLPPKRAMVYYRQEKNEMLSTRSIDRGMWSNDDLDVYSFLITVYEFINGTHPQKDIYGKTEAIDLLKLAKKRINVEDDATYRHFFQNGFDGAYKNKKQVVKKLRNIKKNLGKNAA